MEQENKSQHILVVKLVKGKVNGIQKLLLKEGSSLHPLLEKKCFTTLNISSIESNVPRDIDRKVNEYVWRRCTCGMTFKYQNGHCVSASFQTCRYCCKAFHDIKCLETHIEAVHQTIKKHSPNQCNSNITDSVIKVESAALCENQNEKNETDRTLGQYHKCHYCNQCFHLVDSLKSHLATVHTKIRSCPCNNCNHSFHDASSKESSKVMNNLVDNKIFHENARNSNQQAYIYKRKRLKKSYQCSFCPRKFSLKYTMVDHECAHTGNYQVLCDICGKMLASLRVLKAHVMNNHRERDIPCDFCDKLFASVRDLKRHLLVHTQEKPHKCTKCGRYFAREYTLMMHLRVHNNFKPHVCKICGRAFCQPTNLKTHMRNHGINIRRRAKNEKKVFDNLQKTMAPMDNSGSSNVF